MGVWKPKIIMYGANVTNIIIYNKSTLSQSEHSVYFWVGYFCNVPIVHLLFTSMLFDFKKNKQKSCRTKNLGLFAPVQLFDTSFWQQGLTVQVHPIKYKLMLILTEGFVA